MEKLLSVVVPCYNSAAYMARAIESLLPGGDALDVLIVDDGSTDETGAIADRYAEEHPGMVRVIHQENGGHGAGLNRCIETAEGIYMKVLDSDDRLDREGLKALLALLKDHAAPEKQADLAIHDYVYDKAERHAVSGMFYNRIMPEGRLFGWEDCRRFPSTKQFMIHSLVYRVAMLREHGFVLPEHSFYEDNLYIYKPLPWTRKLLYLHRPVYGYDIGRDGQSINEQTMIRRLDQLTAMITKMACSWPMAELDRQPKPLRNYMISNVAGQILNIASLQAVAGTPETMALRQKVWQDIRDFDPALHKALWNSMNGRLSHMPGKLGDKVMVAGYRLARRVMHF